MFHHNAVFSDLVTSTDALRASMIWTNAFILALSVTMFKKYNCIFHKGKRLINSFAVLEGPYGPKQCIEECLLRKRCQALEYNNVHLQCELSDSEDMENEVEDSMVAMRTMLTEYEESLGSCAQHRCIVGEKCIQRRSGLSQCVISECESPPDMYQGSRTTNLSVVGTAVQYQCICDLEDAAEITCKANGQWSSLVSTCCLDEIEFNQTCTFENGLCDWRQDISGDMFDWTRHSGETGSSDTGPSGDHTTGTGYYVYTEVTGKEDLTFANLMSKQLRGDETYCLDFYYHMYGTGMGSLTVFLNATDGSSNGVPVFSKAGDQLNLWHHAEISIAIQNAPFLITFQGTAGTYFTGDIAIDDVLVYKGSCG